MLYSLEQLCALMNVTMFSGTREKPLMTKHHTFVTEENPLAMDIELCRMLTREVDKLRAPMIYEENGVYLICAKMGQGDQYLFAGPMSPGIITYMDLHEFYKQHGVESEYEKHPPQIPVSKIVTLAGMLSKILNDREYTDDELLWANRQNLRNAEIDIEGDDEVEAERITFKIGKYERGFYQQMYQEEMQLLNCVRSGDLDRLKKLSENRLKTPEKQEQTPFSYYQNNEIGIVTLVARAAIDGGMQPAEAYMLNDAYINKIVQCEQFEKLYKYRRESFFDFTERVIAERKRRVRSDHVEQCKEYVQNHYRHKITLATAAKAIGVSPGYLSHLFMREEGISIADYVMKVRLERAENLLKYSDATLAEISDYVNFSTQSHFGSVFKRHYYVTPQQYRRQYRKSEYFGETDTDEDIFHA